MSDKPNADCGADVPDLLGAFEDSIAQAKADRSAGRWCQICDQHGSHHTDRHNLYETQIDGSESS